MNVVIKCSVAPNKSPLKKMSGVMGFIPTDWIFNSASL